MQLHVPIAHMQIQPPWCVSHVKHHARLAHWLRLIAQPAPLAICTIVIIVCKIVLLACISPQYTASTVFLLVLHAPVRLHVQHV